MASKLLVAVVRSLTVVPRLKSLNSVSVPKRIVFPQTMTIRSAGSLIPRSQYDTPFPKKMKFSNLMTKNWELIPLFGITFTSIALLIGAIYWSIYHKVDVAFDHKNKNISRTMNLLCPTGHKFITINQCYEPWEQMHDVLCKMKTASCKQLIEERKADAAKTGGCS